MIDILAEREKIDRLAEIQSIGFKVIDDDFNPRTMLVLQDINGQTYEMPLCSCNMSKPTDDNAHIKAIAVNCALEKAFGREWYKNKLLQVLGNDISDVFNAVNAARKLKPFREKGWINEKESRMYDHVAPEHII